MIPMVHYPPLFLSGKLPYANFKEEFLTMLLCLRKNYPDLFIPKDIKNIILEKMQILEVITSTKTNDKLVRFQNLFDTYTNKKMYIQLNRLPQMSNCDLIHIESNDDSACLDFNDMQVKLGKNTIVLPTYAMCYTITKITSDSIFNRNIKIIWLKFKTSELELRDYIQDISGRLNMKIVVSKEVIGNEVTANEITTIHFIDGRIGIATAMYGDEKHPASADNYVKHNIKVDKSLAIKSAVKSGIVYSH